MHHWAVSYQWFVNAEYRKYIKYRDHWKNKRFILSMYCCYSKCWLLGKTSAKRNHITAVGSPAHLKQCWVGSACVSFNFSGNSYFSTYLSLTSLLQAVYLWEGSGRVPGDQKARLPSLLLCLLGWPPWHPLQRKPACWGMCIIVYKGLLAVAHSTPRW